MSDHQLITVEFRGDRIFAVETDAGIMVVAKPICERFGLAWQGQHQRMKDDPVLREGIKTIFIPSPGGMQETTCLRLDLLNGWLFKIDSRRVKPEVRDALIAYQKECYAALFAHFSGRTEMAAPAPEGMVTNTIPSDMAPGTLGDGLTIMEKVSLVREARLAHDRAAARRMWAMVGLPDVTGRGKLVGVIVGQDEGRACLGYVLGCDAGGRTVADWVADGQDGAALNRIGLRVREDGLFVAHGTPVFAGSRWSGGQHRGALMAMGGVHPVPNPLTLLRSRDRGLIVPLATIAEVSDAA